MTIRRETHPCKPCELLERDKLQLLRRESTQGVNIAMSKYLKWYQGHLARTPVATQLITTGILFGAGDVLAQQGVDRVGIHHDIMRTGRMAFFGAAMAGPVFIGWYRFLDRFVNLKTANKTLMTRVALDQLAFAPINIACESQAYGSFPRFDLRRFLLGTGSS